MGLNTPGSGAGTPDCLCLLGAVMEWGQGYQVMQNFKFGLQVGSSVGLDDLGGLFQPQDSVIPCRSLLPANKMALSCTRGGLDGTLQKISSLKGWPGTGTSYPGKE